MFNTLCKYYDWYHVNIQEGCEPPKYDTNILAPLYFGKINISGKTKTVEISLSSNGIVNMVKRFNIERDDADYGAGYVLTPSCIQHRKNGSNKTDKEYAFFNKFSFVFNQSPDAIWANMVEAWITFHKTHSLPGDISVIETILNFVRTVNIQKFLTTWNQNEVILENKTLIVFTDNGKKIFDNNPDLIKSYQLFYETWMSNLYDVQPGKSGITGEDDLLVREKDGSPISFGISYANGQKLILKPQNSTTLDTKRMFSYKNVFSNIVPGIRDLWKAYNTFDYLCEQQREFDLENRNVFFFIPQNIYAIDYTGALVFRPMLEAIKKYQEGFKWKYPEQFENIDIAYIYWTSATKGRSSIPEFDICPTREYMVNIRRLYDFFEESRRFYLYRIPNILEVDNKFIRGMQHELIHSILYGRVVPDKVVKRLVRKSLDPVKSSSKDQVSRHYGYSGENAKYYYRNVLEMTVAILLYNKEIREKKGTVSEMSLNRANHDRSYLYGRMVATYQYAEETAMRENRRVTNAEKSMNAISSHPFTSIGALERKTRPYLNRLANTKAWSKNFIERELQEICTSFEKEEDFQSNAPLDSNFIIGYYCQRQSFFIPKNSSDQSGETIEDNVENLEAEGTDE